MDAIFGLIAMLSFFVPIFIVFIVYAAIIGLIIWFVISFLKIQRERNHILLGIKHRLNGKGVHTEVNEINRGAVSKTADNGRSDPDESPSEQATGKE